MKRPNHAKRERAPTVQNLGHSCTRTDHRFQTFSGEPLLLKAELDRLDSIGREDGGVRPFVRVDERREHFEVLPVGCAWLNIPEPFELCESGAVVRIGVERADDHVCSPSLSNG